MKTIIETKEMLIPRPRDFIYHVMEDALKRTLKYQKQTHFDENHFELSFSFFFFCISNIKYKHTLQEVNKHANK